MNKICGYSCEHNKGGVCQITNCDKKIMMTTTTEPQTLTRWQDPTIEDLKKEINKLTAESTHYESKYYNEAKKVDKVIEYINTHSEMTDIQIYGIENTLAFRGSLEKLLNILKGDNNE